MFSTLLQYLFLLSTYPLARWVLPNIKDRQHALIFHLTCGIAICSLFFSNRIIFAIINAIAGYLILDSNPYMVLFVAFLMNMSFHLYQLFVPESLKVVNLTIMIFLKIVATSFNLEDARRMKMNDEKLTPREKVYHLEKKPSLIEWLAYCFTPFGAISTPIYEFRLFDYLLNLGANPERVSEKSKQRAIESLKKSFFHGAIYFLFRHAFSIQFYKSDFFNACPLIIRIILVLFLSIIFLSKSFMMWGALEAGYHQAGLGDAENTEDSDFTNGTMAHLLTRTNVSEWRENCEHNFQMFWKYYIKSRITKIGLGYTLEKIILILGKPLFKGFYGGSVLGELEKQFYTKVEKMTDSIFKQYTKSIIPTMIVAQVLMLANRSSVRFKTFYSFFFVNWKIYFIFWIFAIGIAVYYHFVFTKKQNKDEKVKQE